MVDGLRSLGQRVTEFDGTLEGFEAPPNVSNVEMTSDEVYSSCPITGQPDFYTVWVSYAPDKLCIESKSMKLYLQSFATKGAFCEALSQIILEQVWADIKPKSCRVDVTQKPRGGISIVSSAFRGE